jgi:hypothetical protein
MCLDQLTHAWAYEEPVTTAATSGLFRQLGQSYTPEILNGILDKLDQKIETPLETSRDSNNKKSDSFESPKAKRWTILSILYQVVGRLPYFARRRIFKIHNYLQGKLLKNRKRI